jgi:ABC-type dipeptide/oligopeptide/nickel transport system permease component
VTGWLLRRGTDALLTTLCAVVTLIALVQFLPGDPLTAIIGDHAVDATQRAALEATWGTNRSAMEAIGITLANLVRGDLGISLATQRPVTTLIAERLGPTLLLGALTLLVTFAIGLSLGLWSALHPTTLRARLIGGVTLVGYALPSFVIGMLLVWSLAGPAGLFPPAGFGDPLLAMDASPGAVLMDRLRHLALPLLTMVIATVAVPVRQQRAAALATAGQPWVLAARARGVLPARLAIQHVWRPALTPIVTLMGLWLPMLVAGAVFVEALFGWPGLGSLIATSTSQRDLPVVIGAGSLILLLVQLGSLLADLLYRIVNPAQRDA